jgi:hypothetical protein
MSASSARSEKFLRGIRDADRLRDLMDDISGSARDPFVVLAGSTGFVGRIRLERLRDSAETPMIDEEATFHIRVRVTVPSESNVDATIA